MFGKIGSGLESASKDAICLNAWLEGARSWNRVTCFLALNFLLVSPEDICGSILRLLGWASVDDRIAIVEESGLVSSEVALLHYFVRVCWVHSEEFVDGPWGHGLSKYHTSVTESDNI